MFFLCKDDDKKTAVGSHGAQELAALVERSGQMAACIDTHHGWLEIQN
jgi:hypothetical protein